MFKIVMFPMIVVNVLLVESYRNNCEKFGMVMKK